MGKAREWWLQERAEVEAAYEKEIQILRDRLSRATDEADRADIEREIREAEDAYMEYLRAKVVAMSRGVVRDRTPTSVVLIESRHLPPAEGEALERAASTWAALEPPRTFEECLILGNAFHMAGDFERSLLQYDAALELRPGDPDALTGRGMILLHLGRKEEAVEALQCSLASRPDDLDALDSLGCALSLLHRPEEAVEAHNRALDLQPDEPVILENRAAALAQLERYEEALVDFNRSLELRPDYPETLNSRAIILTRLKRYKEALTDLDRSLELRPDDPDTLNNRGTGLYYLQRYDEALADYNRSLELRPDDPAALYRRACVLSRTSRYEEPLPDLRAAIAADAKYRRMAREDEDFEGLRNDPQWGPKFRELVGTED